MTFNPAAPERSQPVFFAFVGALACPSISQCTMVDGSGDAATFDPHAPGSPVRVAVDPFPEADDHHPSFGNVTAIACASASQCTVLDSIGQEVTFNPAAPSSPPPAPIRPDGTAHDYVALACPSTTRCTAVDHTGREVTFDPTAAGSATSSVIDANHSLGLLACPSSSQCTALDALGQAVTFDPAAPGNPTPTALTTWPVNMRAVACPAPSQCTAIDAKSREQTFDPLAPGSPAPVALGALGVNGLACPSPSQCTLVDGSSYEITLNPIHPVTPTRVGLGAHFDPFGGVACPSISQCTAGVTDGVVSFNPNAPRPLLAAFDRGGAVAAVACPSIAQCTSVNEGPNDGAGRRFTFNPARVGRPTPAALGDGIGPQGLACPSASQCTAVDGLGRELTFNPLSPGTGVPVTIDSGNGLSSVACPSVLQCTAVDDLGQEITFDPAVPAAATASPIPGAGTLASVSCSSVKECVAVDTRGNAFVGVASRSGQGPPPPIAAPRISGTARRGHTLIEHRGTWTNSPSAYNLQWEDCDSNGNHCVPIFGAASRTYTLQAADIGHTVRVLETATNPDGPSVPVTSNVTSVVTAPNVTVRDVRVRGARVAVRMRCEANVDASCTVSLTLTAVETVKNGKVIAVAASKRRGTHPLITQRTVLLGRATVRLAAGQSKTVLIFLNALGRRLLSQRHRLSAQLVVKQAQHVLFQRRFTIKPSRH